MRVLSLALVVLLPWPRRPRTRRPRRRSRCAATRRTTTASRARPSPARACAGRPRSARAVSYPVIAEGPRVRHRAPCRQRGLRHRGRRRSTWPPAPCSGGCRSRAPTTGRRWPTATGGCTWSLRRPADRALARDRRVAVVGQAQPVLVLHAAGGLRRPRLPDRPGSGTTPTPCARATAPLPGRRSCPAARAPRPWTPRRCT